MAFAVAKGLAARQHSVFLAYETAGPLLDENRASIRAGQKVRLQPFGWRMLLSSLETTWELWQLGKRWRIDAIFTSHLGFLRNLALLRVFCGIPFIYHLGLNPPDKKISVTWAIKKMAAGISPSKTNGSKWLNASLPEEKLHIVPNWVDFERFAPVADKSKLRLRLELPADSPLIVYAGRMVPEKGVEILIRAFAKVHRIFPKAVLLLVGGATDSYAASLKTLCNELGVTGEAARQIGHSKFPELYFAVADIAVIPSIVDESFGLTAVEAMGCGALTIVSSVGELAAIVGPENNDLVFQSGNTEALARVLENWIAAPQSAAQRGPRLRNYALSHFQASDKIACYENIINKSMHTPSSTT